MIENKENDYKSFMDEYRKNTRNVRIVVRHHIV